MLYTTKDIAELFGTSLNWVYNRIYDLNLKPYKIINSDSIKGYKHLYSREQVKLIESQILKSKNVMIVEINYFIIESRMNNVDVKEL